MAEIEFKINSGLPGVTQEVASLNLNLLARHCYENAANKGFWENYESVMDVASKHMPEELVRDIELAYRAKRLMEASSELGEALEAQRKGISADLMSFMEFLVDNPMPTEPTDNTEMVAWEKLFKQQFEKHIKDSREDELADTLIRLFQSSHGESVDISTHVKLKMAYNSLRKRLHGKKHG